MIETSKLTKRYGHLTAVDDVSFSVKPGEVLGFLGPNGRKATTMRLIAGFLAPAPGGVRVRFRRGGGPVGRRARSVTCLRARRATAR
jgi:ABC-type multidrug transport system ATPase subunit